MLTGGLRPAALSACSAARNVASGPFWLTAPRPIITLPKAALSTMAAASGGEVHSDGSNCLTSYMKYMPTVRFAPASKRREHARLAVGRHHRRALETRILQEVDHHLAALLHIAVLRGDGGQGDPVLQALDGLRALRFDRRADGGQIAAELAVDAFARCRPEQARRR